MSLYNPLGLTNSEIVERDRQYIESLPVLPPVEPADADLAREEELLAAYRTATDSYESLSAELEQMPAAREALVRSETSSGDDLLAHDRRALALPALVAEALVAVHEVAVAHERAVAVRQGRMVTAARADWKRAQTQRERARTIADKTARLVDAHGLRLSGVEAEYDQAVAILRDAKSELEQAKRARAALTAPAEAAPATTHR